VLEFIKEMKLYVGIYFFTILKLFEQLFCHFYENHNIRIKIECMTIQSMCVYSDLVK
jgi:hypothetical protein